MVPKLSWWPESPGVIVKEFRTSPHSPSFPGMLPFSGSGCEEDVLNKILLGASDDQRGLGMPMSSIFF